MKYINQSDIISEIEISGILLELDNKMLFISLVCSEILKHITHILRTSLSMVLEILWQKEIYYSEEKINSMQTFSRQDTLKQEITFIAKLRQ